jgi:hypothetical protein
MSTTLSTSSSPNPHATSTATRDQRTREAREAFTTSLSTIGSTIDSDLQSRAKNIHSNASALKVQEDQLTKSTKELGKDSRKLEGLVQKTKRDLEREIEKGKGKDGKGLEERLGTVEEDLMVLEEMMRIVEEGDWDSEGEPEGEEIADEGDGHENEHEEAANDHSDSLRQEVVWHGEEPLGGGKSGGPANVEHPPPE